MSREELEFLQEEDGLNDSGIPVTPQAGEYHEGMGALGSNSPIVGRSRKEKRFQDPNSPTRVSDSSPKRSTSRVQSHKDPGDPAVANDVFQSKVKMSPSDVFSEVKSPKPTTNDDGFSLSSALFTSPEPGYKPVSVGVFASGTAVSAVYDQGESPDDDGGLPPGRAGSIRRRQNSLKKRTMPKTYDPYEKIMVPESYEMPAMDSQRKTLPEIFSGNVALGEVHTERACKKLVQTLAQGGHYKVFILEQVTKDCQDELNQLLLGTPVENLKKLNALCLQFKMIYGDFVYRDMLSGFCGRGADGVKVFALDRAGFDYEKGAKGGTRVVGMNEDCESLLSEICEDGGNMANILAGKCVVYCGDKHISRCDKWSEPGIPERLNQVVRRICPDKAIAGSPMLFQGASISDVPPAGCKEAPEFVSILPRESAVAYGKSDEIHVSCVIGIDPDKKGGKLDMIRELQDPVITDVFQVNALLTAEDKAVDNKAGLAQADAEDGSPSSSVPLTGSVSGGISEETRGLFAKLAGGSPGSQTRINEL